MAEEQQKPKTVTLNLTPKAREIVENIREDTGVPNTTAMERFLEWLGEQDRKFRVAVLTKDPELKREMARLVLADMAAIEAADPGHAQPVPVTVEQATRIIRVMLGHIERIHLGMTNAEAPASPAATAKKPRR